MKQLLPFLAVAAMCASSQAATVLTFPFSSSATPSATGDPLVGSFSAAYTYIETLDDNGDPLPVPSYRVDTSAPALAFGDPSARGYGAAISGNAPSFRTVSATWQLTNASVARPAASAT